MMKYGPKVGNQSHQRKRIPFDKKRVFNPDLKPGKSTLNKTLTRTKETITTPILVKSYYRRKKVGGSKSTEKSLNNLLGFGEYGQQKSEPE